MSAGTIAALGTPDTTVDDATPPRPELVYGRHKRQAVFGRLPPIATRRADRAGFRHDGDLAGLARAALDDCGRPAQRDAA